MGGAATFQDTEVLDVRRFERREAILNCAGIVVTHAETDTLRGIREYPAGDVAVLVQKLSQLLMGKLLRSVKFCKRPYAMCRVQMTAMFLAEDSDAFAELVMSR